MVVSCNNITFDNHPSVPRPSGKKIIDGILTLEQRRKGLSLKEDDHCLYLYHKGKLVAVFSTEGATPDAIREKADWIGSQ